MDKRKPIGRTVDELQSIFLMLPEAGLCFDFAHARQYDPSMTEAYLILTTFADRIRQLHLSEVPTNSKHDRISPTAATAYRELSALIPPKVPVILETPVRQEEMDAELAIAQFALAGGKSEWLNSTASG
jgi:endonuclease IV